MKGYLQVTEFSTLTQLMLPCVFSHELPNSRFIVGEEDLGSDIVGWSITRIGQRTEILITNVGSIFGSSDSHV